MPCAFTLCSLTLHAVLSDIMFSFLAPMQYPLMDRSNTASCEQIQGKSLSGKSVKCVSSWRAWIRRPLIPFFASSKEAEVAPQARPGRARPPADPRDRKRYPQDKQLQRRHRVGGEGHPRRLGTPAELPGPSRMLPWQGRPSPMYACSRKRKLWERESVCETLQRPEPILC